MNIKYFVDSLALGAFIGCFVLCLVGIFVSLNLGPENVSFSGVDIINGTLGSIVIGFAFSLPSFIYKNENVPLPLQILFQMGIGMFVLFAIAIYLKWLPLNLGITPILVWITIAVIFAVVFWLGFYLYYWLTARSWNKKINQNNFD